MSQRKSTLYADLLNNRLKVTLKGHIGALIHLLYKLFYSKTGYFISGFYCIWATKIADKIFFLPQSWHAHDSGRPGNPALGLLLPPGSARFRPPRSPPPPPPLSVCPRPSLPLEAARSFSSPQFSWGVRRVGRVLGRRRHRHHSSRPFQPSGQSVTLRVSKSSGGLLHKNWSSPKTDSLIADTQVTRSIC